MNSNRRGVSRVCFPIHASFLIVWALICIWGCGCSRQGDGGSPDAAARPLRIGTTMHIKHSNPLTDYYYSILAMIMTHDSLIRFDEELQPVPQLAAKFGCDREGKTWTFDLAENAKWHDGLPVTPDDVRFTFHYIREQNLPTRWIADLIESLEINDKRMIFHLKKPYSPFLINAGFVVRILPRHVWEKVSDPFVFHSKDATIGCGPYVFDSFENGSGICRFHLNSEYYGRKATVENIEFRIFKSIDVLTLALRKKQIHAFYKYASGFPAPYMKAVESQPELSFLSVESMGVPAVLGFNFDRSFLRRVNIRRAVSLALDYKRFNLCLMDGEGRLPGAGLVPPVFPSQAKLPTLRQSIERSREILASEGFIDNDKDGFLESEDGKTIDLMLLARSDLWGDGQVVKLLAGNLAKVGIRLSVQSVDLSTWQSFLRQGKYDLVLFRTTPWGMMMHAGYGSGYFDSRKAGGINICRLNDDAFFKICDQILSCTDPETLKGLYRELQIYYAEQLPAVALCWGKSFFPFDKEYQGFQVNQLEGGLANRFSWNSLEFQASHSKENR